MKTVMEQYAKTVLAVFAALGIFSIFSIVFGDFGTAVAKVVERDVLDVKTGDAFDEYMDDSLPVFTMLNYRSIKAGMTIPVSRVVEAKDSQGEILNIQVSGYWNENFQETDKVRVLNETKLNFSEPGIYWIEMCAADRNGCSQKAAVKLYVNAR